MKKISFAFMIFGLMFLLPRPLSAQESEETPPKYNMPYKNTYVKEALVAENEYRIAKPKITIPKSFEEAKKYSPQSYLAGA